MSDSKSNVINFPNSAVKQEPEVAPGTGVPPPTDEVKAQAAHDKMLELIDTNRQKGLQTLDKKVEDLTSRELHPDAKTEAALRDIQSALAAILTHLEAEASLVNYLRHDLMAFIQNLEGIGQQGFQASAHLQTLIALLVSKNAITHAEMKQTWDMLIKPKAEALAAGQKEPTNG